MPSLSFEILLLGERKDRNICGFTVGRNWENIIFEYHITKRPYLQFPSIKSLNS
jgi:hypothetical protein